MAGGGGVQLRDRVTSLPHGLGGALGVGQEGSAGVGQPHSLPGPDEELLAELRLERVEPGGEGRLADIDRLRRAAHVAPPGDLEEPLHLRQQHKRIL